MLKEKNTTKTQLPENFLLVDTASPDTGFFVSSGSNDFWNPVISLSNWEDYLKHRQTEKPYGLFNTDIVRCDFFNSKNGETILADIEKKNIEQGMGNVTIPNTNIRLINYSVCPKCGEIFSFRDLTEYYRHPQSDNRFHSIGEQARGDTRVRCFACETWFLPTLVIVDKSPRNEVQFLCRNQTMDAVEIYFLKRGKKVLTKNKANILVDNTNGYKAVKNDVILKKMKHKPTLISNLLQYTPIDLALNLMDGTNIEKGDVLYGWWGKALA
jgi:hypothetical protein